MNRRRGRVELPEYLAMVRRILRSAGTRCADADPEDLAQLLAIRASLDASIQVAVDGMREAHGFSWTDIGRAAGVTRQAAQQRWGMPAPIVTDPAIQARADAQLAALAAEALS